MKSKIRQGNETAVTLIEVGPRDGLQSSDAFIDTKDKITLIQRLAECGFSQIEASAFVHPKWIPALADHRELMTHLLADENQKNYFARTALSVLAPNERGFENAIACGCQNIALVVSASDTHNQKNLNSSIEQTLEGYARILSHAREKGLTLRVYLSCVFDCPYEGTLPLGTIVELVRRLEALGANEVALGDTIGAAVPNDVQKVLKALRDVVPVEKLACHFHDTRGLGVANALCAYDLGVRIFDASLGGLGGCPYAPGASGNVASEDLVYAFERSGVSTGVSLTALAQTSLWFESISKRKLPSKVFQSQKGGLQTIPPSQKDA